MESEIEKNIKSFFRNLLKDCEEKMDHSVEQSASEASRRIFTQSQKKLLDLKIEIEQLCEEKKEDLSKFALALMDQMSNCKADKKTQPIMKKRNWKWLWTK